MQGDQCIKIDKISTRLLLQEEVCRLIAISLVQLEKTTKGKSYFPEPVDCTSITAPLVPELFLCMAQLIIGDFLMGFFQRCLLGALCPSAKQTTNRGYFSRRRQDNTLKCKLL